MLVCLHLTPSPINCYSSASVPTGACAVLVHNAERSLVANLAAANTFSVSHLDTSEAKEMIARLVASSSVR